MLEGIRRTLIMLKINVPLLLSIVYTSSPVCKSFETHDHDPKFGCTSFCDQIGVETGYAGICCGKKFLLNEISFEEP